MTNQELYNSFININLSNDNPLDKIEKIAQLEKDYKNSELYKNTKLTIYETYRLFLDQEGRTLNLINQLTTPELIEPFLEKVINIFDVEKYMNNLSSENKELMKELLPYVKL